MRCHRLAVIVTSVALAACTLNGPPTVASSPDSEGRPTSNQPGTSAQSGGTLFTNAPADPAIDMSRDIGVVRNRYVGVDFQVLMGAASGRAIGLNLFDDVFFTGIVEHVESSAPGASTVTGHLNGVNGSSLTLVESEGTVIGSITTATAHYQVRYAGNGVHAVREFDPTQLPREAPPIPGGVKRPPDGE